MCFVWIGEKTAIISLYSSSWLVFIAEMESVYRAVRAGYLSVIQVNLSLRSAKKSVFMCFVWIRGKTAIISLYNIQWLFFVAETDSVYCAVRTEYI
jgi:hypothetical protein